MTMSIVRRLVWTAVVTVGLATIGGAPALAQGILDRPIPTAPARPAQSPTGTPIEIAPGVVAPAQDVGFHQAAYMLIVRARGASASPALSQIGPFGRWSDCINAIIVLYNIPALRESRAAREITLDSGYLDILVTSLMGNPLPNTRPPRFYRLQLPAFGDTPAVQATCLPM